MNSPFTIQQFDGGVSIGGADDASSLYVAADIHNLANNGESFWDDPLGGVSGIPKFIGLGIASGVNQLYNIAPTIGNWFGGEFEQNKLADTLAEYDSDLAKYYTEHQQGIDVLGFALSSLVPGTAGVKVLRAGQVALNTAVETGVIGSNLSKATGLLAPSSTKHVITATEQLIKGSSPFTLQNANVLRALGSGMGQNVLEGAAFELAVAATMYNSPVLENQDLGDMMSNMLWGAGLYGVIGGAVQGARSVGQIKKGIKAFDTEASPWTHIEAGRTGSSPADNILLYNEQRLAMPSVVPGVKYDDKLMELGKNKQNKLDLLIRGEFQTLSNGDTVVADLLHKSFMKLDSKAATGSLWEMKDVMRLSSKAEGEKLFTKLFDRKTGVLKEGTTLKQAQEYLEHSQAYLLTRGSRAGKIQDEVPVVTHLADKVKKGQVVELNAKGIKIGGTQTRIAGQSIDMLKASHIDTEARLAWARAHFTPKDDTILDVTDIPLLDATYAKVMDGLAPIPMLRSGDITFKPATGKELLDAVLQAKQDMAAQLVKKRKLPHEVVAKMVNMNSDYLAGKQVGSVVDNAFADLAELAAHNAAQGTKLTDMLNIPSVLKLAYKKARVKDIDGFYLQGMEAVQRQQRLYTDSAMRTVATVLEEDIHKLVPITMEEMTKATRLGAGASFMTFASGNYGSLGSKFEFLGKVTTDIIAKKKAATREVLEPLLYKLQNNQAAAVEWSKLMQEVRGSQHTWKLADDGKSLVIADEKVLQEIFESGAEVPQIVFKDALVSELAMAHVELNGARVANMNSLRTSQGLQSNMKPNAFYAPPPNPKDHPYFAFVIDPSVTGTGHSKMLYAASEAELKLQMASVRSQFPEFKVIEKGEAERYYKAVGQFDYEKTLNENYIDTALKRKGVSAPFLIKTDPKQIADEALQWHLNAEAGVVREAMSHAYEPQFEALRKLGEQYTLAATSKFGGSSLAKYAEATVENPYTDYIKTALGINKAHEYPFWMPVQKMFDNKVSQMWDAVKSASVGLKDSADLQKINGILLESGYKGAYYDAALNSAVNSKVPRGVLSEYVQESNAVLSLFALRLDPLNALNNVIGSNVLLNTEIRSLLRNIETKNTDAAGELASLMKLKVPGTDKAVLNHGRLIANALRNFHSSDKTLHDFYKANKFTTDIRTQYLTSLDTLALKETETISSMANKRKQLIEVAKHWTQKGEKLSGNTIAEEFNRFVAADVMRQITDVAVKHGVMDSRTALSYINTFVNRTQGNFLAAQRPMAFQGPVGQAIGLFQTYQFNLIQQLFRHVAECSAKDTAMLLGLQGSIYGMNGMPAFNAINTHIIGNASGNTEHRDLYSAVYGGAGKDAGDWLMYGLASNMFLHPDMKVNMYTRGDINPRHVTILPTNPADVPFINSQIKFFGNLFETMGKLGKGGDTSSILLQGIEHNGVSRPLAGLAQTMEAFTNPSMQVYSTNKKGNIVGSNDFFSLMTLGRLLGGKPLDEAITQDAHFRLTAYATHNSEKVAKLGEVVKSTMLAGGTPDTEQVHSFMDQYVQTGGKQDKFNQFMLRQLKNASKSQAEQVRDAMTKPYAHTLQQIMGGYDPTPTVTEE
jgi:hypothetical protein